MTRRWVLALGSLLGPALLAGCANLLPPADGAGRPAPRDPDATAATAPQPAASAVPGDAAAYGLQIDAPEPLRSLLNRHLDLARFQILQRSAAGAPATAVAGQAATGAAPAASAAAAPGEPASAPATDAGPAISRQELDRLVAAAPAQARALLETEGYFQARVQASRDDAVPPAIRVQVDPGPRVTIDRVALDVRGALADEERAGDTLAVSTLVEWRSAWPLAAGQPFQQERWADAKTQAIARLRGRGYPLATWAETRAQVDPETGHATLHAVVDSGPRFRFGATRVRGLNRYERPAVLNLRTYDAGDVYQESLLADFQERLTKAGLFESSSATLDVEHAKDGVAPVVVRVRELPQHQATTGVGVSANTGPRVSLEHVDRRVFGWNATAKNTLQLGRDERSWDGEIITHPQHDQHRWLLAGTIDRLDAANQVVQSWRVRAGRTQDRERLERLYFAELVGSSTVTDGAEQSARAVSLNLNGTWRRVDDVLLPTQGVSVALELGAGYAFNSDLNNGPFGRVLGRGIAYLPLGQNWYSQFRLEAGQILSRSDIGLPDPLLFRAGGDDSVRGYGYRTLGPVVDGSVTSGRYLLTGSAEFAHPILARMPALLGAVFVDAGNAANSWSSLTPVLGYGVGVRYRSPIGPLRVDLAYGQEERRVRLHLSVGIAL